MFGPYREILLSPKKYETVRESGLAWKILEYATLNKSVAYVNNGPKSAPATHWLAFVKDAKTSTKFGGSVQISDLLPYLQAHRGQH